MRCPLCEQQKNFNVCVSFIVFTTPLKLSKPNETTFREVALAVPVSSGFNECVLMLGGAWESNPAKSKKVAPMSTVDTAVVCKALLIMPGPEHRNGTEEAADHGLLLDT